MDSENQNIPHRKPFTEHTVEKSCGCNVRYIYPDCTKQDLVHGGCIESCACWKYKVIMEDCNNHNKQN